MRIGWMEAGFLLRSSGAIGTRPARENMSRRYIQTETFLILQNEWDKTKKQQEHSRASRG
jgi:hypothetical protein